MFVKIFQKWVSKLLSCRIFSYRCFQLLRYPQKTADISRQHHRVPRNLVPRAFSLIFLREKPWGRGWVSREIKPVMGSRNVGYFPCQAPQTSLPRPTSMFFLSKKTCRNTIGSLATRNQCESHRAQNSVKIGILFRT